MTRMRTLPLIAAAALLLSGHAMAAQARLTISSAKTKNMACSAGVCAPTAASAVLNVGDLATMLAAGNVEITTTGSGVQANDIRFEAAFSWTGTSTLWLNANTDIDIAESITVKGAGGLSLSGSGYHSLFFLHKGEVTFKKLTGVLTINGSIYTLVNDIASLAGDIGANPAGYYALASNYNAARDGTYNASPITTNFTGIFEGLGHRISNLTIDYSGGSADIGLFASVESSPGILRNIGLTNANVTVIGETGETYAVGTLAGIMLDGEALNAFSTGSVNVAGAGRDYVGGLGGSGVIALNCWSAGSVNASTSDNLLEAGGLAGQADSVVTSYAAVTVAAQTGGGFVSAGGLAGCDEVYLCYVENSYATGAVSASAASSSEFAIAGGLEGTEVGIGSISSSYSTGTVAASGAENNYAGGSVGWNAYNEGTFTDLYWDISTSGTDTGVGNGSSSGVTGLTTAQFQSGLPAGLEPSVWREKPKVNGGLPYLITNPPSR